MTVSPADHPWLRRYDDGVPRSLHPYPSGTLLDHARAAARETPRDPALLFMGTRVDYARLLSESDALAAGLAARGLGRGDRLALLLPNCPQFVVAELAAWSLGAIVVPLNPLYTSRELEQALQRTAPVAIVTLTRFYRQVSGLRSRTSIRHIIAVEIKEYFPPPLRLAYTLLRERGEGDRVRLLPGDTGFGHLLRQFSGAAPAPGPPAASDPAVLLMSGGTTGAPKAAIGTHGALVASGAQLRGWLAPILRDGAGTVMLPLPLFHVFGNAGVQAMALLARHPLSLVPNPRDIPGLIRTIEKVRPVVFAGVPALFAAMLEDRRVCSGRADLSSLRGCFSGAAALQPELRDRFERTTGGRIVEGYSLTEAMMACIANPVLGEKRSGSVGVPLPDVEVAVVDALTGERELGPDDVGEVVVRAPQLMAGYWNDPEGTAEVLRSRGTGAPWLYTGDLGRLDEDHVLTLVDRKKDLIKVSGLQVWPKEIEDVIASHPAVAEVGVAGVPHDRKGEVAKAWVVLREGAAALEAEIRDHCRRSLAPYKVPAFVEFRAELPRNLMGKVLRRELRMESAPVGPQRTGATGAT